MSGGIEHYTGMARSDSVLCCHGIAQIIRYTSETYMYIPMCIICPGGEIGRHERLKISWGRLREGSSPFPGILVPMVKLADTQDFVL